jgi:DsbC/DsbD-like thiol-disulfide interchange protein
MKQLSCFLSLGVLLILSGSISAQEPPKSAKDVVKTQSYVSMDPVPRGKDFQVAVVLSIDSAYHMNSHKPADAYLIPTTLTPQLPDGFKVTDTLYPAGQDKKFPFSPDKPLNVYSGTVTLRMKLTAENNAPLGATSIPITLRYQACNQSACLPPVKIPVTAQLKVAAAGTAGHAEHPEIFKKD